MADNSKSLMAIIALVILFAAAFFLLSPKEVTFSTGFNELKQIWQKQGIRIDNFAADAEKIPVLSGDSLLQVKIDLKNFESKVGSAPDSQSKQTLLLLADIYINLTDMSLKDKTIGTLEDKLSTLSTLQGCQNISLFKQLNTARKENLDLLKMLSANTGTFISAHPEENKLAMFSALDFDFAALDSDLSAKEESVISLEQSC